MNEPSPNARPSSARDAPRTADPGAEPRPEGRSGDDPLLDLVDDAVVALDHAWRFTRLNTAAERLVRQPRAALLGLTLWEAFPPALGRALERECRGAVEAGEARTFEAFDAAHARWVELRVFPGADGVVLLYRDVTARHRHAEQQRELVERLEAQAVELEEQAQELELQMVEERELAERLALLGAAVHASTESVVITTAEVDPPGPRIVFVNPAMCRMTGYAERELLGRTPRMLQGPQTDRALLARLRAALVAGEPFSGRTLNYRKDGTPYTVEWDIAPVRDMRAQLTHFVAVQRDVSARERLENQVRQAQKMEAVGQLAGGVAHDFNNLLTVIVNHVDFLRTAIGAHDPRHDELDGIRHAADAAMRLTRQLLTFSRHQPVARRPLDVNAAVRAAGGLLRRVVGEHIVIDTALGAAVPPVLADPGELEQVILNLAVNARDAMPGGGRLRLATAAAADGVRLDVRDTGHGMDEATRARIFEPFFTTKRVGEGTGLGLATVFGIIERLRGTIAVASEPGRGTTFSIWLPRAPEGAQGAQGAQGVQGDRGTQDPQGAALARSAPIAASGAGEVVLMVEDEPALRRVTRRVLVGAGYVVHEASGGEEALAVAARLDRLDLLLTDVVMPGLRGSMLAERLRQARAGLRVLYVSGYTDDVAVERERTERGTAFLQKPFDSATLTRAVRAVLDAPLGEPLAVPPPSSG